MKTETTQKRNAESLDDQFDYDKFAPKPLSAKQTVIMTGLVLGGLGVLMGLLWWIN